MNTAALIRSLERFPDRLQQLVDDLSEEDWRRKPSPLTWSTLEIVCHLRDEERTDFRPRLQSTLQDPGKTWPSIDPAGAALANRYNEQEPRKVLREFLLERDESLRWLGGLTSPDWRIAYNHPQLGTIHAGDLLAAWSAHDLLHLRQITKRLFESISANAFPFQSSYAGTWAESS